MRRTPNPNGNPVAVRKKGDIYKVRYYPRGCSPTPPTARNSQASFAPRPHPKRRPLCSVSDSSSTEKATCLVRAGATPDCRQ